MTREIYQEKLDSLKGDIAWYEARQTVWDSVLERATKDRDAEQEKLRRVQELLSDLYTQWYEKGEGNANDA